MMANNQEDVNLGLNESGSCRVCGSKLALAETSDAVLLVDGEIARTFPGDLGNPKCLRCHFPEEYTAYHHLELCGRSRV